MGALQRMNVRPAQRAAGAIAVEPGFARMDDERRRAGRPRRFSEGAERLLRLLLVDADPALDTDRNVDRRGHRRDAVGDKVGLAHQAGAETAVSHPVGRAAAIEIDFVIAKPGAENS